MAPVQPSVSVATTGLQIVNVAPGKWSGLSGWKAVNTGADTELFNFAAPSANLSVILNWSFDYDAITSDKYYGILMTFNAIKIWNPRVETRHIGEIGGAPLANKVEFIIPAYTEVVISAQTDDDATEAGALIVATEI